MGGAVKTETKREARAKSLSPEARGPTTQHRMSTQWLASVPNEFEGGGKGERLDSPKGTRRVNKIQRRLLSTEPQREPRQ